MRRSLLIAFAVLLFLALTSLLGFATHALLLVIGGAIGGTVLRGGAAWIAGFTGWSPRWALAALLTIIVLGIAGLGIGAGSKMSKHASELGEEVSTSLQELDEKVKGSFLEDLNGGAFSLQSLPMETWFGRLTGGVSVVLGALADVLILCALSMFFALDADLYVRAVSRLFPNGRREKVAGIMRTTGRALRWWFLGRAISMIIVAVFTSVGLMLLGVRLPIVLGLLAGLLSFVPNIGPLLSIVPALALGWLEGPRMILWVLLLYVGVQVVESNAITPFVQKKMVSVPPALLLSGQVLFGALWGIVGLFLATPIVVVLVVLVQRIYVEEILGEDAPVLGS